MMISRHVETANLVQILKNLNISYEIREDSLVVVRDDIDLSSLSIKKLPNLSGLSLFGSFYCYDNKLKSLQGSPSIVNGHFYCGNNQLENLIGAPSFVGGNFDCSRNPLNSSEGMPDKIIGNFYTDRDSI